MKKLIFVLTFIAFLYSSAFSQAQLGRVEYQKKDRQAVVVYTQYPTEIVEAAIMDKMERFGNKGKEVKGFLAKSGFLEFKNASVPEIEKKGVDLYFKADRKSRHEKQESVIYLVIGKGSDEFATSDTDPVLIDNAKEFMNNLLPFIEAYNLEVQIKEQEGLMKKITGKLNNLIEEAVDLEKKMKGLEEKLSHNSIEQEKQKAELEKQRLALEAMKNKRKTN